MGLFINSQYPSVSGSEIWRGELLLCVWLAWEVDGHCLPDSELEYPDSSYVFSDDCDLLASCICSMVQW